MGKGKDMPKAKTGKSRLDYYEAFRRQAQLACDEADLLVEVARDFTTASAVADYLPRAHRIENEADELNHAVMQAIDVDFITPFERTDIIDLTNALDDIVDGIEEVVRRLYMFDVHFMHRDALTLALLVQKAANLLLDAMDDFRNLKRFGPFIERMREVNAVEEEADAAYLQVMRRLFTEENANPMRVMVWRDIFDHMEECADRIDRTGAIMGNIILKNS